MTVAVGKHPTQKGSTFTQLFALLGLNKIKQERL